MGAKRRRSPPQAGPLRIAIDGPAGTGKSTVAARLAAAFGLPLLDTGALYRTLALAARRARISWNDAQALAALAAGLPIRLEGSGGGAASRVRLAGEDVSEAIRAPEMSLGSSEVARHPEVRAALLPLQRRIAAGGVVAEGRDIGTVVIPDASVKIFLTATAQERARRRVEDLRGKGIDVTIEETLREQEIRDARDEGRAASPLRPAEDAVVIDTTGVPLDEVVARAEAAVALRTGARATRRRTQGSDAVTRKRTPATSAPRGRPPRPWHRDSQLRRDAVPRACVRRTRGGG